MRQLIHPILFAVFLIIVRQTDAKRTNFLIIIADDLGIGDVGCFGNTTLQTPNIDRIAREGVLFTHSLAAAEVCTPSRAAIMTGRYPVRSGMSTSYFNRVLWSLGQMGGLPPSEITFAKIAQEQGYSTALIGKWHLGLHCKTSNDFCHHPNNHGFTYYYGLPWTTSHDFGDGEKILMKSVDRASPLGLRVFFGTALVGTLTLLWLLKRKHFITFFILAVLVIWSMVMMWIARHLPLANGVLMRNREIIEQPFRIKGLINRFVNEAKTFLHDQVDREEPFLLMVSLTNVHTSLVPTKAFVGSSRHGLYGDSVQEMDWGVGKLLNALDELKLTDDTFVIFTSDHGAHVEEKGADGSREGGYNGIYKGGKGMGGMDGALRVPTVVRWPKRIEPGSTVVQPTSLMDIFPTVLSAMNVSLPTDRVIDGKDLLPLTEKSEETEITKNTHKFLVHYCGKLVHAARLYENENSIWKAHFITPNWIPGKTECDYICPCRGNGVTYHDPPIIYNIAQDPSEDRPLPITEKKVKVMLDKIHLELKLHLDSVAPETNEFNLINTMWMPWLQPCCNFPYCNCLEKKYSNSSF